MRTTSCGMQRKRSKTPTKCGDVRGSLEAAAARAMARPSARPARNKRSGAPIGEAVIVPAAAIGIDGPPIRAVAHGRGGLLRIPRAAVASVLHVAGGVVAWPISRPHVHILPCLVSIPHLLIHRPRGIIRRSPDPRSCSRWHVLRRCCVVLPPHLV